MDGFLMLPSVGVDTFSVGVDTSYIRILFVYKFWLHLSLDQGCSGHKVFIGSLFPIDRVCDGGDFCGVISDL